MSYPYLSVNPCCTDVVLNSPCGCTSTITNSSCGSNDPCSTHTVLSSNVIYNGPILPCIIAEPCDTLNVILQKIDQIICTLLGQITTLQTQVNNINAELLIINNQITNINNTLDVCCVITTTTSTTRNRCESFSLDNTGEDPVAITITDCITGVPSAILLLPGDTNICVITDSPLTVPGTVIATPFGPCGTTTTTSTSSSTTTSTTTVYYPCECLTFNNIDIENHIITYVDCNGNPSGPVEIFSHEVIKVCGSQGFASDPFVSITIGANCIFGSCPEEPTTSTTSSTSTTTTSSSSTSTSTSSTSTTTTSTTCNPATSHPFTGLVVNGTNTIPDSGSFLVDACGAAACLQNATCVTSSSFIVYWNQEYPELGDVAYVGSTGCTLAGLDGYYQIDYDGIWVVVQIINSVIVDFPSCTTTTTTTTVVDCINYLIQGNAPSGSWEGFDCNGTPISGTVIGGGTEETGCMNAVTLVLNNAYVKDSTPCTTTTTTTTV